MLPSEPTRRAREHILLPLIKIIIRAYILNPTIYFEKNNERAIKVDAEKRAIYEPCLLYFSSCYQMPLENWKVASMACYLEQEVV